jgi:hypothetical protein
MRPLILPSDRSRTSALRMRSPAQPSRREARPAKATAAAGESCFRRTHRLIFPLISLKAEGTSLQSSVQEISQPDPGLLQLEFDHRARLPLMRERDRGWVLAAQVPVSDRLRQPVPLQDRILDAALRPARDRVALVPPAGPGKSGTRATATIRLALQERARLGTVMRSPSFHYEWLTTAGTASMLAKIAIAGFVCSVTRKSFPVYSPLHCSIRLS